MINSVSNFWEEDVYKEGKQINSFPFTKLITLLSKHRGAGKTCLEVGCGVGNNFYLYNKFDLNGLGTDISETAIRLARERFREYPNFEFQLCRSSDLSQIKSHFDFIIDRGHFSCLDSESRELYLKSIKNLASYESKLFLVDIHGRSSTGLEHAKEISGNYHKDITGGQFAAYGSIAVYDKSELIELLSEFKILELHERIEINHQSQDKLQFFDLVLSL